MDYKTQTYHVLIIEDDSVDYRSIRRALEKSSVDFQYDRVVLLAEAKKQLQNKQYDVVIADMHLPDSSGLNTITTLINLVGNIPIVVLSNDESDSIALEAVHAGAQEFIPKQYISDTKLIHRTLLHAFERHQLKLGLESVRDRERYLAHYDQCTSLPNRLLFLDRINQAIIQAKRHNNKFMLFFIDLDRFKNVNDSIGHSAGDEVLRCVGERMKSLVRSSDTVARFGGDEFVIILQRSDNVKAMDRLARKLIAEINKPITYGKQSCRVGASIGVASYPEHGSTPEVLVKNADRAMYESKTNGRNQVHFCTKELLERQTEIFSIENALRHALHTPDQNFQLHYQPRVELSTGNIYSVEAFIRWIHPKLGNIPPSQFIPLAEEVGLIEQIDEWTLEIACKQIKQWHTLHEKIQVGVNISSRSLNRKDFVNRVVQPLLEKYEVSGHSLELEVTENILLANTNTVRNCLNELKALGLSLAIDNFGTGFSSLRHLNTLPIDILKIDGSFICDKNSTESDKVLLKAIVTLGKALSMKVIAKSVETKEQRQYLTELKCDEGQGFYWYKPSAEWLPQAAKKKGIKVRPKNIL